METLYGEVIERSFPAGPESEVAIHSFSGTVRVQGGEPDAITVVATLSDEGAIGVEQDGNRLTVRAAPEGGSKDVEFEVSVPAGCTVMVESIRADLEVLNTRGAVKLHSVHGDIIVAHADGTHAPIVVDTVAGDIHVNSSTGEMKVSSQNGDIHLTDVDGVLNAQSTNGDVTVEQGRLVRFHVNNTNGEVRIDTPLTDGERYFAKSTNGDVRLTVPAGSGFTAQLKTQNGDVKCDLPHEVINGSKRNRQVRVGGGGATIELETTNGDVRLRQSGHGGRCDDRVRVEHSTDWRPTPPTPPTPATPPTPPTPPFAAIPAASMHAMPSTPFAPQDADTSFDSDDSPGHDEAGDDGRGHADSTLSVLARLESGELSVDEAMERLESLR
jgi:DUF4097 and DUF4098 domain-containing protein YvlB